MSYRIEGRDIVISGFEKGISDNPFEGFQQIKGVNLISTPGEASVNFGTLNLGPIVNTSTITSVDTTAETITIGSSTGSNPKTGDSVTFANSGGSLPGGLSAATTYWLQNVSSNVYKVFTNMYCSGSPVNLTSSGTGTNTLTTITMGRITQVEKNFGYMLDSNGRCWSPTSSVIGTYDQIAYYRYMGNSTTNASGNGLCVYQSSGGIYYLFVFRNNKIDYTSLGALTPIQNGTTAPSWQNDWQTLNSNSSYSGSHQAIVGQDNVMYYCDSQYIGSLREKTGATFDPATSSTYTWTLQALALPKTEAAICIAELGTNLMIGGVQNYVYPWDRIASSFKYPLLIAEKYINSMVTVNNNIYISAGNRGRIFVSNGANAEMFVKIPDNISTTSDPTITVFDLTYYKNQIYFGAVYGTTGTVSGTQYSGVWAVDIDTNALRCAYVNSTTTATSVAFFGAASPIVGLSVGPVTNSIGLLCAWWDNSSSTYGIDFINSTPSASYYTQIDTDLVPVAQYLTKRTFEQVEFRLSKPIVSGESVKISYRTNLNSSFTLIKEWTYSDMPLSTDVGNFESVNFENVQWIQLRYEAKSTTSSPSFVRLTELRIR